MKLLTKKNNQAFTLLELIIVLFLMGLVYTISITSFSKKNVIKQKEYFDLKEFVLLHNNEPNTLKELIVTNDNVLLKVNGKIKKQHLKLPDDIEFFSYLQNDELQENHGYIIQEDFRIKINFIYTIYPNMASTRCIVKLEDDYYTYNSYFNEPQKFDNLYDAQEHLLLTDIKSSVVLADD